MAEIVTFSQTSMPNIPASTLLNFICSALDLSSYFCFCCLSLFLNIFLLLLHFFLLLLFSLISRVKKEPGTDTTIGGVAKTKFAPKIPARRRGTPTNPSPTPLSTSPAPNAQGQGLEFIQMKEERKRNDRDKERDNRKERENQPAKVAFMPSVGGGGDDEARKKIIITIHIYTKEEYSNTMLVSV